ncbi:MAG: squalene/phytoene synthase family protein [Bacteroidetes bacterium]|nr:squalene/phytoene synthase family protein [Bacteroidota bacterium]
MTDTVPILTEAYAECRRMAAHYENFPVGSVLVPKRLRHHFFALYACMRMADDFADLPERPREERLRLLADWRDRLLNPQRDSEHPIFLALRNTITECRLDTAPLLRLLEAFEFDARGNVRFETFDDLRWYTARSADPVGELVLALFGHHEPRLIQLSNEICTGLQLLNFIQDIKEDLANGRYYFPKEDWDLFEIEPSAEPDKNRLALLSLFEADRVESLIDRGAPLAEIVGGRLGLELRAVVHSARRMVANIRRLDGNTYLTRPTLTRREQISVLLQSLLTRAA